MSLSVHLLVMPILLAVSALLSASETALFSLDEPQQKRAGSVATRLMRDPQSVLIALLFTNLVVNVAFFSLASGLAETREQVEGYFVLFGALIVIVLFGEILPKTLALRAPIQVARISSVPVAFLVEIIRPVRRVLRFGLEIVMRTIGEMAREERGLTTEALAEVLEGSARHGLIEGSEADLLAEVVELEGIRVREIMTPRVDLLAIDLATDEDQQLFVIARALARRFTWLPVFRESPDAIVGCVRLRDVLAHSDRSIRELVQKVLFVPEVASVLDLLRVLRDSRATEAVVVDEYGGTAGVVTIENIFEEIVGDLRVEGEQSPPPVVPLGEGRFRVLGSLSIRDWNEQFGREIVPGGFETVGGFVTALLGRIPRAGDRVRVGDLVTEVREVRGRRVQVVDMYIDEAPDSTPLGGVASKIDGAAVGSEPRA